MKRLFVHMIIMMAASVLSCGCTSNHVHEISLPREFQFNVTVNPCTRTADELLHPSDVPLGMWSFDNDGTVFLEDEMVTYKDEGKWVPENQKMWDEDIEEMDFIAYSPYGEAVYDKEKGICFLNYDIDEGLDLLYSDPLVDQKKEGSSTVIQINMMRALSLVRFKARTVVPDNTEIVVKRVEVENVRGTGDFQSFPEPHWTNYSSFRDFCFYDGSLSLNGYPSALGDGLYMIPQFSNVKVNVLCDIIKGEVALRDQMLTCNETMQWRPGKIAAYLIKIDGELNVTVEKDNE